MPSAPHQKRTLVAIVEDHPGVMSRVVSMFRRRGFNIAEIAVGPTETPNQSRITLLVDASNVEIDQVIKQLYKLIEVLKVVDLTEEAIVERELALIKVNATAQTRAELMQLVSIYEARIVDLTRTTMIIEIARSLDKVEALIGLLRPFGIKEVARTGRVAMTRGTGEVYSVRDEALA
ncbi:MAG: acetolactate synthase small subunit [Chloroflexi bacterium]|nr:acetolactate synthase small subunit [Chloroflexota bacterium]